MAETIFRADYRAPSHLIDTVHLEFDLDADSTSVINTMHVRPNPDAQHSSDLILNGETLTLVSVAVDGLPLDESRYTLGDDLLTIHGIDRECDVIVVNRFSPSANKALSGIYTSGQNLMSQCEAQGFRRITYFLDRPDVLSRYSVVIRASKEQYPVLLSNGNRIEEKDLDDGRHEARWEDPFPKPCYLFALVAGRLEALRTEPLPGTRALLLTSNGRSMERIGALARVTAILEERGVAVVHMGVVEPNPTVSTVMKVAARMKDERCDFLVALGGGSVMDCAKISGLMATNPGELWDYVQGGTGGRRAFEHDPLPLVAITTTAGTGSEVDAGGVITNPETREKVGIGHPGCFPKLAIVDPELMVSVPPALTAYQGFDALFHAVEGYVGKRPNFMSDMYALEAVRHLAAWLPKAVADGTDIKAREHVAFANTMAGFVMTTTRLTSHHAMEHALSAFHPELPHGAGLIMLSMAYFGHMVAVGAQSERFVALARAMGIEDAVQPSDFLSALSRLIHDCGMQDLKMSDWGITCEELPAMTEVCRSAGAHAFEQDANYFTFEDTLAVYEAAFR